MTAGTLTVLGLVMLLQVKHVVADYMLQNAYMLANRRFYGHPGGLLHVAIHAAGSLLALLVVGVGPGLMLGLLLAEAVVHYHVDWAKDNFVLKRGLTVADPVYWHAAGIDQGLHQATYVVMAAVWAAVAVGAAGPA
jgi:hypothetical protein